jgi:MoaA/NifB/PqqE/SkfB family radical SAM enzyme
VPRIGASLHVAQRQGRNGVRKYIDNFLLLKNKRFNIDAPYVCYPPLIPQLLRDFEFFKSEGVIFFPTAFRGTYNGNEYPESYTEEERSIIRSITAETNIHKDLIGGKLTFIGHYCHAGSRLIDINEGGQVSPCVSARGYKGIMLGNMFDDTARLLSHKRVCTFEYCRCPDQGLEFAERAKANQTQFFAAKLADELHCQKRKLDRVFGKYVGWRFSKDQE